MANILNIPPPIDYDEGLPDYDENLNNSNNDTWGDEGDLDDALSHNNQSQNEITMDALLDAARRFTRQDNSEAITGILSQKYSDFAKKMTMDVVISEYQRETPEAKGLSVGPFAAACKALGAEELSKMRLTVIEKEAISSGNTILHSLLSRENNKALELIPVLAETGVDLSQMFQIKNNKGQTPLDMVQNEAWKVVVQRVADCYRNVKPTLSASPENASGVSSGLPPVMWMLRKKDRLF